MFHDPNKLLTGPEKAAVLLLSLSEKYASKILSKLNEREVRDISLIMATIGNIPPATMRDVCNEFTSSLDVPPPSSSAAPQATEHFLSKCLNQDAIEPILTKNNITPKPSFWDELTLLDNDKIANYLKKEHPQTLAAILSRLQERQAAQILCYLPDDLAVDALLRFLELDEFPSEIMSDIENTMMLDIEAGAFERASCNPYEKVADIFGALDPETERQFLQKIKRLDKEAANRLQSLLLSFDGFAEYSSPDIKAILKVIDHTDLALALKGACEEVRVSFMSNLSESAAKRLRRTMDELGMVKLKDIDTAQTQILNRVKSLALQGKLNSQKRSSIPNQTNDESVLNLYTHVNTTGEPKDGKRKA